MLPRYLVVCQMERCYMHGLVELRTLPKYLKILQLVNNAINGTLQLTGLPSELKSLKLGKNSIETVVVSNQRLPGPLESVNFYQKHRVRVICLDDKHVDQRVRVHVV